MPEKTHQARLAQCRKIFLGRFIYSW